MSAFFAIAKLTWKSAFRSHLFQFLLVILLLGTFIIPNTIKGDGSAYSFIQVSLEYSLAFISIMLMLSGIWLGCQTMTQDVEDSRIHLIVVKPVSRVVVWLGKFTGVLSVLTLLLVISTAVVYGFITWRFKTVVDTSKAKPTQQNVFERERISNEILTGRRLYDPVRPNVDRIVAETFEKFMNEKDASGRKRAELMDAAKQKLALIDIRRTVIGRLGEVPPGITRKWEFVNLPKKNNGLIFIRYKVQSGLLTSSETRKLVLGAWGADAYFTIPPDKTKLKPGEQGKPEVRVTFISRKPEQIPSNMTNELEWPAEQALGNGVSMKLIEDGRAVFGFSNFQKEGSLYFQQVDGPRLLIPAVSFAENYIRAVIMMFLAIMAITMISCSIGAFLSLPTAIFFALSYLMFGVLSLYIRTTVGAMYENNMEQMGLEYFGYLFSEGVLTAVIPFQRFDVADYIANGELIELSMLAMVFFGQILLKGGPIALLGIWLYNRRELALASTKR